MKRHLLNCVVAAVILALASFGARAEEQMLYWMIDENNKYEFEYAVVYVAPTANLEGKSWTAKDGFGVVEGTIALPKDIDGGFAYEPIEGSHTTTLDILTELGEENWSAYSFYIELLQWDADNEVEIRKGVSELATYSDLTANHHVLGAGLTIPSNLVVWRPTTTPEPTSGLLLLLGNALLALRRRKR